MNGHTCISALDNCYALAWSYGEICCHSNCCGRYGRGLKMWRARLSFHRQQLKEAIEFDNWIEGWEELQKKNNAFSINYHRRKIKQCRKRITHFKEKTK